MKISSPNALIIMAASLLMAGAGSTSAQSNARDFGPPSYGGGLRAIPTYGSNYLAPNSAAYASPYAGYQPIGLQRPAAGLQTPVAATACAYNAANSAYRTVANNPYAYGAYAAAYSPYTAAYAPNAGGNTSYWSSTTPRQYTGNTMFGSQTVYGKDEPLRNLVRFFVP